MVDGRADATGGGFYADPVVYEVLHAAGTFADVAMLVRVGARLGLGRGPWRVLEPACGPGRHLRLLARRGHRVMGVDLSETMVEHARRRFAADRRRRDGGAGEFVVADMARLDRVVEAGSVDLAFCLMNSIRHLGSEAAMGAHLRAMRRVLRAGGVYAVGLSMSAYGLESPSEDVWEGRVGGLHVKQVVQYEPPVPVGVGGEGDRMERVISEVVVTRGGRKGGRKVGGRVEHRGSVYGLFCWSRVQWERAVAEAGLVVREVTDGRGARMVRPTLGYGVWWLGRGEMGMDDGRG